MNIKNHTALILVICLVLGIMILSFVPREVFEPVITGKVITKVFIIRRIQFNCSFSLYKGWNLVSMPCLTYANDRDTMLATINSSYYSIHTYIKVDTKDPWKSYNPSLPSWVVQDLSNITEVNGYWFNMTENGTWNISGKIIWPFAIDMYQGWNLVGFHSNATIGFNDSLDNIKGKYSAVYQYDANHSQWLVYYPNLPPWVVQNLTNMTLYYGYWINMTQDSTWIYGA